MSEVDAADAFGSLVRSRHSVRGFKPDRVAQPLIEKVFEDARWAPSGTNVQPWQVLVGSGDVCERLRKGFLQRFDDRISPDRDFRTDGKAAGVWLDRKRACARALYGAMGIDWDDRPARVGAARRNYEFFGAPHVAFFGIDEVFGVQTAADIGMFAQSLMLSMTANGLASCAQGSLMDFPDFTREVFEVVPEIKILFGLSFGFADDDMLANCAKPGRVPLTETVLFRG